MFKEAFEKMAVTVVTMTPEQYYELVREKDPAQGALVGGLVGAAAGARKGAKGKKSKAALLGAAAGAAAGGTAAHYGGKAVRKYQARRVRRLAGELHLRTTPAKQSYEE